MKVAEEAHTHLNARHMIRRKGHVVGGMCVNPGVFSLWWSAHFSLLVVRCFGGAGEYLTSNT